MLQNSIMGQKNLLLGPPPLPNQPFSSLTACLIAISATVISKLLVKHYRT